MSAIFTNLTAFSVPGTGVVQDVVQGAFDKIAQGTLETAAKANKEVLTFWVNGTTQPIDAQCSYGANSIGVANCATDWLQTGTRWIAILACVVSLIICGAKMAISANSGVAIDVGKQLLTVAIVSGAGLALIQYAVYATDEISAQIFSAVPDVSVKSLTDAVGGEAAMAGIGGWLFILAICSSLVGFAQFVLLIARSALIVVIAGLLPIAAASSGTEAGNGWFKKLTCWLVALIIYKPVAVIIYTMAYVLSSNGSTLIGLMSGFVLMLLAIVAMPATMRLIVPPVSAATSKGGTLVAGAGAVATGAMMVGSGGSSAAAGAGQRVASGAR